MSGQERPTVRFLVSIALIIMATACKRSSFSDSERSPDQRALQPHERERERGTESRPSAAKESRESGPSVANASSGSSDKRPTDDNEGVDGYLVDPRLVVAAGNASGASTITGQPGAIKADRGDITRIVVAAWRTRELEQPSVMQPDGGAEFSLANLACGTPKIDGAFTLPFQRAANGRLILTVGVPCTATSLKIPRKDPVKSNVFVARNDNSGIFTTPSFAGVEACMCPAGEVFIGPLCGAPPEPCNPSRYRAGPMCGCNYHTYASFCEAVNAGAIGIWEGACSNVSNGPI